MGAKDPGGSICYIIGVRKDIRSSMEAAGRQHPCDSQGMGEGGLKDVDMSKMRA